MEQPPRRPANSLRMPRRGAVARVLWCGLWCGAIWAGRADNNGAPASRGKTSPEHKKKLNEITDYFVTPQPLRR